MDLEALKKEVMAQAEECRALITEKNQLTKEAADIAKKNVKEILTPAITEVHDILQKFHVLAGYNAPEIYMPDVLFDLPSASEKESFCISFSPTSGVVPYYRYVSGGYRHNFSICFTKLSNLDEFYWLHLFSWFGTEEKTQEFLDICLEKAVPVFSAWQEYFEKVNAGLAETVRKIKEQLSGGSTVEQQEDGTVEIHLGGKTYTATLKED